MDFGDFASIIDTLITAVPAIGVMWLWLVSVRDDRKRLQERHEQLTAEYIESLKSRLRVLDIADEVEIGKKLYQTRINQGDNNVH